MEKDPLEDRKYAHPKARELMKLDFFWDVVDEAAPFGSDEGWSAYYDYLEWRKENHGVNLIHCMRWILHGRENEYSEKLLCENELRKCKENSRYDLNFNYDMNDLDTTIISTALSHFIIEGTIDEAVKPILQIAIKRQLHPISDNTIWRCEVIKSIREVFDAI